ncbi:hypothetical protein MLOOGBEN_10375 [Bacillus sp. EB106-08-02-XG196]|uniref:hypothetical protein n=1 Tax=Bacillus sp. EB106-08-02-XG196 TaxID=2737049 RepID=UPI0015C4BF35|nr:hypothetical protein [Bacillus sp. EB106-08-02-XG196]NWQ41100.1 hypothetical protein [Bacillus sp. EB106-08-02-XG196]
MEKQIIAAKLKKILNYLVSHQKNGVFPARSSYGETFSLLALSITNQEIYKEFIDEFIDSYGKKDKSHYNFHWEFNNYALLTYLESSNDPTVHANVFPLKFKGTSCTNWTILRGLSYILSNDTKKGLDEINIKIKNYQLESGLIMDDPDVKSLQYHCFSMALIAEVYERTNIETYKDSFLSAVDFISNFILKNGMAIYIGRGQEQIFGYGPLLFSLEYAFKLTNKVYYKHLFNRVFEYVFSFQREDGSIPLVIREKEKGYPEVINVNDKSFLGWYNYNNYFDYLPFFAYYLSKTLKIYKDFDLSNLNSIPNKEKYSDDNYLVFSNHNYDAVIAKPGGYWTNDLPVPLIVSKQEVLTPCYGGEQYGSLLYSPKSIPLPWGRISSQKEQFKDKIKKAAKKALGKPISNEYYFRDRLQFRFNQNSLIGEGHNVKFERHFSFREREIEIKDIIVFKRFISFTEFFPVNLFAFNLVQEQNNLYKCILNHNSLFIKGEGFKLDNDLYYCTLGEMNRIYKSLKDVSFSQGDSICYKYSLIIGDDYEV